MRDVLAPKMRGVLERFAGARTLVAFDFDGTLAPIVGDADRAAMRPSTRRLLERVAGAYPCAVISGRSRADVARRLRGVAVAAIVGNHGLEPTARRPSRAVAGWRRALVGRLGGLEGVTIETKGLSIAVHYRHAPEPRVARARILEAAGELERVRLVGGKRVVNVLPAGRADKGLALDRARVRLRCRAAVYVGDDETDEDVFARGDPERLLSIRVGRKRGSAAPYYIRRQADIDRLLARLLSLRAQPDGTGRPPFGDVLEFLRLLWAIDHGLQKRSKRMASTLGVTGPQRLVIRVVGRIPGISAGQLAEVLHLDPSTLTGVLRRLEGRGLLTRHRDLRDGRRALLALSEAGRRLDVLASGTIEAAARSLLGRLPPAQIRAARRVLQALAEELEERPASDRRAKASSLPSSRSTSRARGARRAAATTAGAAASPSW